MNSMTLKPGSLARLLGCWRVEASPDASYRLLARALRLLIIDGRISLGVRLPGERELAQALGVSRTTLTAAYGVLRDEGFLRSRQGSGSVTHLPGGRGPSADLADAVPDDAVIDWTSAALPAPAGLWQVYEEALRRLPPLLAGHGYEALGLPCLRQAIARDYERRGCPTRPDQIMVTNGGQSAVMLIMRALTGPGDRVVVDHPTYHNALAAIARNACQAIPVALPEAGWDIEALEAAIRQAGPRLAYLLPDFHNPTGRLMSEAGRREIVEIAARTRTSLLIDETMAETGFKPISAAAVATFDPEGHWVLSVGSVSKRYWGGLRIGWIRAGEQRIADLARLRVVLDMGTPVLEQLAVTVLLERGEGMEERRALTRARCDILIELLADALPHWRVEAPEGGLALWVEMPHPQASALAAMAQSLGVRIVPGPRFSADGGFERYLRLPFTLSEEDMKRAVEQLAHAEARLGRRPSDFLPVPSQSVAAERVI